MIERQQECRADILLVEGKSLAPGQVEYRIDIREKSFKVFFRSTCAALYTGVEPALPLALLGAMRNGYNLRVLSPLSKTYAGNVEKVTNIFSGWYDQFSRIKVQAEAPVMACPAVTGRVGLFFSGGVDSFYTLLHNIDSITDLIYIHGFDVRLDDFARRRAISDMGQAVAHATGKRFIEIESNLGKIIQEYGEWTLHGGGLALAAVGRVLQGYLDQIYISSDMAFQDLRPWSLHPATVPLFNDETLSFVLFGSDATRLEKIDFITRSKIAMNYLRVCWERVKGKYNCGECEKCLRTMTSLYALDALEACMAFDCEIDVQKVRRINLWQPTRIKFLNQNLRLMEERGLNGSPLYLAWQQVKQRPRWWARRLHKYQKRWVRLKRSAKKILGPSSSRSTG